VTIAKTLAPPDQLTSGGPRRRANPRRRHHEPAHRDRHPETDRGSDLTVPIPPRAGARATVKPPTPGAITDIGGGITGNERLPVFPRPSLSTPSAKTR
jgi:hypothetical protein